MERTKKQQIWHSIGGSPHGKLAELSGAFEQTTQSPADKKPPGSAVGAIKQSTDGLFSLIQEKNLDQLPQTAGLNPHLDVGSLVREKAPQQEKKASAYALPSRSRYPLDSYQQVKEAASYFNDVGIFMEPEVRREYCANLVKRAHALDVWVPDNVEKYGSDTYASPDEFEHLMDARRDAVQHHELHAVMLDKLASMRDQLEPQAFALALREFDKMANLEQFYGGVIQDAYYTTFGKVAADENKTNPEDAIIIGNEYLTGRALVRFAQSGGETLKLRFGEDFTSDFAKDPRGIFDSLPRDQKLVIMRMANTGESQIYGATT